MGEVKPRRAKIRLRKQVEGPFYFEVITKNGRQLVKSGPDHNYTQKHNAVSGIQLLAEIILEACGLDKEAAKAITIRDWTGKRPAK